MDITLTSSLAELQLAMTVEFSPACAGCVLSHAGYCVYHVMYRPDTSTLPRCYYVKLVHSVTPGTKFGHTFLYCILLTD